LHYNTATISSAATLLAQLRMLRLYLRSRPAARGALQKTVGFGGASYISLSLSTPIKIGEKSSSTMAAQDEQSGELRTKTQQSPLASQRPDGQAPGRIAKWFPLSASDGLSQWVSSINPRDSRLCERC
jgi:cardiolipin-specific phospholipase